MHNSINHLFSNIYSIHFSDLRGSPMVAITSTVTPVTAARPRARGKSTPQAQSLAWLRNVRFADVVQILYNLLITVTAAFDIWLFQVVQSVELLVQLFTYN